MPDDQTPLVLSLNATSGITDNMIYRIVKDLVKRAASDLQKTDAYKADKLRRASNTLVAPYEHHATRLMLGFH